MYFVFATYNVDYIKRRSSYDVSSEVGGGIGNGRSLTAKIVLDTGAIHSYIHACGYMFIHMYVHVVSV